MSNTKRDTGRVFGIVKDAHTVTAREKLVDLRAPAKPVSSAVLILHDVAPQKTLDDMDHTKLGHDVFGRSCQARRQQFPDWPFLCRELGALKLR